MLIKVLKKEKKKKLENLELTNFNLLIFNEETIKFGKNTYLS